MANNTCQQQVERQFRTIHGALQGMCRRFCAVCLLVGAGAGIRAVHYALCTYSFMRFVVGGLLDWHGCGLACCPRLVSCALRM